MRVDEFSYTLPESLIAQFPSERRGDSRLMVVDGESGALEDRMFAELPERLRPGDLLVLNDTRVVRARIRGRKSTGGSVEVLLERVLDARRFLAQLRASKSPKPGSRLILGAAEARVCGRRGELFELELANGCTPQALMEAHGEVPLPPYIHRDAAPVDVDRYQTVYASRDGAVAAPTAGLHFDREMLEGLRGRGVDIGCITLHVGAGTFQPVRSEQVEGHRMHKERVEVSAELCNRIAAARARRGRIVAVGTTCVRALETASREGSPQAFQGETDLFIYPGCRFRCVDAMLTNFHLPKSTLLMLVCAFAGRDTVLNAYRHAVERGYRFFSYGDAMLVTPSPGSR